ncbi:MAG: hypothetical protein SP4CHLAM5_08130 [Chlamydiia bacterium]|nr:hypothetical protein [Chlamydiia bacterium]MCH9618676.1 hypothetical protein [Chlamydiia bacterium]MCH9624421.1 hypothetical protein [Chlamydiia bacterium]
MEKPSTSPNPHVGTLPPATALPLSETGSGETESNERVITRSPSPNTASATAIPTPQPHSSTTSASLVGRVSRHELPVITATQIHHIFMNTGFRGYEKEGQDLKFVLEQSYSSLESFRKAIVTFYTDLSNRTRVSYDLQVMLTSFVEALIKINMLDRVEELLVEIENEDTLQQLYIKIAGRYAHQRNYEKTIEFAEKIRPIRRTTVDYQVGRTSDADVEAFCQRMEQIPIAQRRAMNMCPHTDRFYQDASVEIIINNHLRPDITAFMNDLDSESDEYKELESILNHVTSARGPTTRTLQPTRSRRSLGNIQSQTKNRRVASNDGDGGGDGGGGGGGKTYSVRARRKRALVDKEDLVEGNGSRDDTSSSASSSPTSSSSTSSSSASSSSASASSASASSAPQAFPVLRSTASGSADSPR